MNKLIVCIITCLLMTVVGCRPTDCQIRKENNYNSQNPQVVIENTPKGKLYCIKVMNSDALQYSSYPHFVYWFENDTNHTVSVNTGVLEGKVVSTKTTVLINGIEYIQKQ